MRRLGLIGGMSWSSTALYYEHLNRGVAARLGGLHSARLVIESLDLAPFAAMELAGDWDGVARVTLGAAKRLEAAGADGVIITSNTGHMVYDAVAPQVGVPMLHIADATAEALVADGRERVALLGTRFTMLEPHIRSRLEARGLTLIAIEQAWVDEIDRIIFEELAAGNVIPSSERKLKTLIAEVAGQAVDAVVLGCTELVMAVDVHDNDLPVYDTTEIHARACVEWMLAGEEQSPAAA